MNRKQLAAYFRKLELQCMRRANRARWTHERDRLLGRAHSYRHASRFIFMQLERAGVR